MKKQFDEAFVEEKEDHEHIASIQDTHNAVGTPSPVLKDNAAPEPGTKEDDLTKPDEPKIKEELSDVNIGAACSDAPSVLVPQLPGIGAPSVPMTPPSTQVSEEASEVLTSNEPPTAAHLSISNTSQEHDTTVKVEPEVKEEPGIKVEPIDLTALEEIDLTGSDDENKDKPAKFKVGDQKVYDLTESDDEDNGNGMRATPTEDDELFVPGSMSIDHARVPTMFQIHRAKHQGPEDADDGDDGGDVDNDSLPDVEELLRVIQRDTPMEFEGEDRDINSPSVVQHAALAEEDVASLYGDDDDFVPEAAEHGVFGSPRKRKNQGQPSGPRAKIAREWWRRANAKVKPASRRGYAWKKKQLASLQKNVKQFMKKQNARNPPQAKSKSKPKTKRKGFVDPAQFIGGVDSDDDDEWEEIDPADLGVHLNGFGKRKDKFFEDFLAKFSDLDTHRCKTDWSDLEKKSRSFGYGHMKMDGENRWLLIGMMCRELS